MVITVRCPSCASSFPVDSNKIPEGGVNARCSTCRDIFRVEAPVEAGAPEAPTFEEPEPLPAPTAPDPEPAAPSGAGVVDIALPPPLPEMPPWSAPDDALAAEAAVEEPAAPAAGFRFGKRDPTDKAKRLARVLVSDMIMYNADRHETAVEAGTLREDFEEEIDKSWKEFVEQVGEEMAEGPGRGFWSEALNDILAKGEQLF
jgi:predicted Zn finger-like uncharacterized protein